MQFYFLLNIVIFSRLFYGFKSQAAPVRKLVYIAVFQVVLLFLFKVSALLFILVFLFLLSNILAYFLERKMKNFNAARLLTFLIYLVIIILFTPPSGGIELNGRIIKLLSGLHEEFYALKQFDNVNWLTVNVLLAAVLYMLNEANYFIRYFFELFTLTPLKNVSGDYAEIDTREYNAGRIIGMLERIMIFLFLMENQYAAIGFILAAKGITRFKEMEDRHFAEYVLIGTFLSALTAIIVTLIVKSIISR